MIVKRIIILLILTISSCQTLKVEPQTVELKSGVNQPVFPEKTSFVNDFEKLFTEEEVTFLENALEHYKKNSNREIVIITLDSIPKNSLFDQYAIQLSNNWNIGEETEGNGLTVVLSKKLRRIKISTTDKTRYYLPDDFIKKVIDEKIIPEFKDDHYYDGLLLGLNEFILNWI